VIVMTDGAPTNSAGEVDIPDLQNVMQNERDASAVS
jgi:hypothetical protein